MTKTIQCISPVDGRVYAERPALSLAEAEAAVARAKAAQGAWAERPLEDRIALVRAGVAKLNEMKERVVEELATHDRLLLLCGRYEGFDDRIRQVLDPLEVSVGDFVCNGGEVPAMVVIDTVIRLIPGVLGDDQSAADESHSDPGRSEDPQFTRPRVFRGLEVPEVLLSGNHQAIAKWRAEQSRERSERNTNG
jgi:tRNA (guanine-N1)-methyltransferase